MKVMKIMKNELTAKSIKALAQRNHLMAELCEAICLNVLPSLQNLVVKGS